MPTSMSADTSTSSRVRDIPCDLCIVLTHSNHRSGLRLLQHSIILSVPRFPGVRRLVRVSLTPGTCSPFPWRPTPCPRFPDARNLFPVSLAPVDLSALIVGSAGSVSSSKHPNLVDHEHTITTSSLKSRGFLTRSTNSSTLPSPLKRGR